MFIHFRSNDDDDDSQEDMQPQQTAQGRELSSSNGVNPLVMVFNAVSNAMIKSATNAAKISQSNLLKNTSTEDDEYDEEDDEEDSTSGKSFFYFILYVFLFLKSHLEKSLYLLMCS